MKGFSTGERETGVVIGTDLRVALSLDEAGGAAGSGGGSHPGGAPRLQVPPGAGAEGEQGNI